MKAWELLSDPTHWTTGEYARDANGRIVPHYDEQATCWCAVGAIRKCYPADERFDTIQKLTKVVGEVPDWNDTSDHATVLAKLKELDI